MTIQKKTLLCYLFVVEKLLHLIQAPLDGFWSIWGPFSDCSVECGAGTKRRTRSCTSPPPIHGGNLCKGSFEDIVPCNSNIKCPGKF